MLDLLKHFQAEDVQKLKSKRARLIGNDPGTGKTYEAIALDLLNRSGDGNSKVDVSNYPVKKTLIVCPKNALDVWDEHLMNLTNEDIYLYSYSTRSTFVKKATDPHRGGYFIVNYDSLRIKDLWALRKVQWFHIIGDEIHRIKNRKAQATQALKALKTVYKTGMSGTPADNKPTDLWSILNWLWPNYYTAYWSFVKAYTIQQWSEDGYSKTLGLNTEAVKLLHKEMEPWFVRRRKQDVLKDLPDKYYSRIWVTLGPKQRKAYDQMKKSMTVWFEEHADELEAGNPIIAQAAVVQLVRLQQLSAGYLVADLHEDGSQKIKWKKTKLPEGQVLSKEDWNEVRVLRSEKMWQDAGCPTPDGTNWAYEWKLEDPSAKLDALMELIEDRADESIIVFSQSKAVIKLLGKRLEDKRISHGLYTGDTKQEDRDRLVREFQAGTARVFAGTIKAGGEAITLTRSSTVIFIDRWWSPSKNIQAEDRAHRIGQKNAVEIIDIMARNTVDLGRYQAIEKKWEWLQMLLGDTVDTEKLIKELDLTQVLELEEEVE